MKRNTFFVAYKKSRENIAFMILKMMPHFFNLNSILVALESLVLNIKYYKLDYELLKRLVHLFMMTTGQSKKLSKSNKMIHWKVWFIISWWLQGSQRNSWAWIIFGASGKTTFNLKVHKQIKSMFFFHFDELLFTYASNINYNKKQFSCLLFNLNSKLHP